MANNNREADVRTRPEMKSDSEKALHMLTDANNREISSKDADEKSPENCDVQLVTMASELSLSEKQETNDKSSESNTNTGDTADTMSTHDTSGSPVTTQGPENVMKGTISEHLESKDRTSELTTFFGKKKKQKKDRKKSDAKRSKVETQTESAVQENEETSITEDTDVETDLDFLKWAKKKPRKPKIDSLELEGGGTEKTADHLCVRLTDNTDVNYSYDQLLNFVYSSIKINNPELKPGETKKLSMPYAKVLRDGVRKTGVYNFMEICRALHRQPKHVFDFLQMEFATSGSIDMRNKLTLVGVFKQNQVQAVITRYVREYVECKTCNSTDTILIKKNRMQFLVCESCHSRYTVSQINLGFRAIARRDMRRR